MGKRSMLTTIDNPFNPFDDWDAWYAFDIASGYGTTSFLARVLQLTNQVSDAEMEAENEHAIDEIVRENVLGIYKKVTRED